MKHRLLFVYLRISAISALFHPFGSSCLQHDVPRPFGHAPLGVSRIGRTGQISIMSNSASLRKQTGRWVWFQQRKQKLYAWSLKKDISRPQQRFERSLRNRPRLDVSIGVYFWCLESFPKQSSYKKLSDTGWPSFHGSFCSIMFWCVFVGV